MILLILAVALAALAVNELERVTDASYLEFVPRDGYSLCDSCRAGEKCDRIWKPHIVGCSGYKGREKPCTRMK